MNVISGIYRLNATLKPVNNQARKSVLPEFEKRQALKAKRKCSSEVRQVQVRPTPVVVRIYDEQTIADATALASLICVSKEAARHFCGGNASRDESSSIIGAVKSRAMRPMSAEAFAFLVRRFADVPAVTKILNLKRKIAEVDGQPEKVNVTFFSWLGVAHDVREVRDVACEYVTLTTEHKAKTNSDEREAAEACLIQRKRSERYFDRLLAEYKSVTGTALKRRTILREVARWIEKPKGAEGGFVHE